jgi:hypothetical protein
MQNSLLEAIIIFYSLVNKLELYFITLETVLMNYFLDFFSFLCGKMKARATAKAKIEYKIYHYLYWITILFLFITLNLGNS